LPWSDGVTSLDFVSLEKRSYPFLMWSYSSLKENSETMTIELPANTTLQERPSSVDLSCAVAEYHLKYEFENGKIIATRTMKVLGDVLKTEDYNSFKDFFNKVAEADTKQFAVK
jgi:Domain of Unknown Function with PDB structure (DUF3858)